MKSAQVHIFCEKEDVFSVLSAIEQRVRVVYSPAGVFRAQNIEAFTTANALPNLGVAEHGEQNLEREYLVIRAGEEIVSREIRQTNGEVRFAFDQMLNPHTIVLRPGGALLQPEVPTIIAGRIGTSSSDDESRELFRIFEKEVKRQFSRVKSFWVGPLAEQALRNGARLTTSVNSPRLYDLAV